MVKDFISKYRYFIGGGIMIAIVGYVIFANRKNKNKVNKIKSIKTEIKGKMEKRRII